MKKTLLLLAMIASTASFAGNMVKVSADSSVDFSSTEPTVPTNFAAELSMEDVAKTGLSFGGKLADKTDLYNLSLTKDKVLDGKVNLWAKYEGEVKGFKGSAKLSVDLSRESKKQGFKLFSGEGAVAKEVKSTDEDLDDELGSAYAANASYLTDKEKVKVENYNQYKDVKDGKFKDYVVEKKGTFTTTLSKDFMVSDSSKLTGSLDTKTTFEFAKPVNPETIVTAGLNSKLGDGSLGLTVETANNYRNPNAGFKYLSGKLTGSYKMFDAEAFVKYNFGKQAVALNDDTSANPPKKDRTNKKNELKIKAKLNELTDDKKDSGTKYSKKYSDEQPGKSIKDRIKDAKDELSLSDSAFLEDHAFIHSKYEKSGFSVDGKLKFSNALTSVAKYKLTSGAIAFDEESSNSMQEYMPELMLNLGYKASNGVSVSFDNDLAYKATVTTGYNEIDKEGKKVLEPKTDDTKVDHHLRYFGKLSLGYSKDFASFTFTTKKSVSTILDADLHNKKAPTSGSDKEFGLTTAIIGADSSLSLTGKVTDKFTVTPSLDSSLSVLFNTMNEKAFEGVYFETTPKVSLAYMPLEGLTLSSYVSTAFNVAYDNSKDLNDAFSNNFKTPTVKFGGSLQYNW